MKIQYNYVKIQIGVFYIFWLIDLKEYSVKIVKSCVYDHVYKLKQESFELKRDNSIINNILFSVDNFFKYKKPINLYKDLFFWEDKSEFTKKVLYALFEIPFGTMVSYSDLANNIGCTKGARALGNVLKKNPYPILLPCHRVILKNGDIGNYIYGKEVKRLLLSLEL